MKRILKNKNNESVILIGVNGRARSGKDTFVDFCLKSIDSNHTSMLANKFALADPLKMAASHMFSIPIEHFYMDSKKDEVNEFWGLTIREIAQKVGTECARKVFFDDIWIRNIEKRIKDSEEKIAFVSDIRFNNEAEWVNGIENSTLISIKRDSVDSQTDEKYQHVSESGIDDHLVSEFIYNNSDLNYLENQSKLMLQKILCAKVDNQSHLKCN